ncbi:MAG: hypothetical protein MR691_14830 [Clostridium sp.]|nr:hypothetical protein [Clostridium sp.]
MASINYNDKRFANVTKKETADLKNVNNLYNSMVNNSDKYYNNLINASQDYAKKQSEIQNQQTDFAIEKVEQQKEWANQDYIKEQKGAYTDWQKQSDQYGATAEANAKMLNTGYSESSQVQMYTAYQNRVATARESYNRAVVEYDNAIKDARLQNSAKLAEIAYQALQQKLELSLQGFQYKNTLLQQKLTSQNDVKDRYYNRWKDVQSQINTEKALAEQVRQFNANLKLEKQKLSLSSGSSGGGSYRSYSSRSSSGKGRSAKISKSKKKSSVKATKKSSSKKSSALSRRMIELKAQSPYLYQSLSDYKKVIGK